MFHAHLSAGATTFSLEMEHSASFDREGRLFVYSRGPATYRRSLASGIYRRVRRPVRQWTLLGEVDVSRLKELPLLRHLLQRRFDGKKLAPSRSFRL